MRQTLRVARTEAPLLRRRIATEPTTGEAVDPAPCRKTMSQRCVLTEDRYSQRYPHILRATLGFQGLPPQGCAAHRKRTVPVPPFRGSAQPCTTVRSLA